MDRNSKKTGSYRIATPKKTITVYCEFTENKYKSVFYHADSGQTIRINGFEERGRYSRQILYNNDFQSIVAIVDASDFCEQKIETTCRGSMISGYSWFTDRTNTKIPFWAGGQTTGCKCGIDNSCAEPKDKCNCDKNDDVVRNDHGSYTDKSLLPLSWVKVGDTGGPTEYLKLKIWNLVCHGSKYNY